MSEDEKSGPKGQKGEPGKAAAKGVQRVLVRILVTGVRAGGGRYAKDVETYLLKDEAEALAAAGGCEIMQKEPK